MKANVHIKPTCLIILLQCSLSYSLHNFIKSISLGSANLVLLLSVHCTVGIRWFVYITLKLILVAS